jgi:hypothetical protein
VQRVTRLYRQLVPVGETGGQMKMTSRDWQDFERLIDQFRKSGESERALIDADLTRTHFHGKCRRKLGDSPLACMKGGLRCLIAKPIDSAVAVRFSHQCRYQNGRIDIKHQ